MSLKSYPRSHFDHKVAVWRGLFHGCYNMDTDILQIITRAAISAGILILIGMGMVIGWVGVSAVTIILGVDLAAAFKAFRESQQNKDVTYQDQ